MNPKFVFFFVAAIFLVFAQFVAADDGENLKPSEIVDGELPDQEIAVRILTSI